MSINYSLIKLNASIIIVILFSFILQELRQTFLKIYFFFHALSSHVYVMVDSHVMGFTTRRISVSSMKCNM